MSMNIQDTLDIIAAVAKVPSFSSFEERLHSLVQSYVAAVPGARLELIEQNNLVIHVKGDDSKPTIALAAHLDKINHFGKDFADELPFMQTETYIQGQMDDSVGVGLCLKMMFNSLSHSFPPLLICLSEMEESTGLREHPEWLKKGGKGYQHGMGAEAIARYLVEEEYLPEVIITIDTTPLFKGEPGLALYDEYWKLLNLPVKPELEEKTLKLRKKLVELEPNLRVANNTNDYLVYGRVLNRNVIEPIPSIALEPAIYPYHQKDERVFIQDIERLEHVLIRFLEQN